jgi:membrane-bound acyltransferase YfiQ involved in biofilm formation
VAFYLLAPVLVRLGARYPWLVVLGVGAYQLFIVNVLKPGTLGLAFPAWAEVLTPPGLRVTLALWAIYFPLGVVYGLQAERWLPWLARLRWGLVLGAVAAYGLAVLTELGLLNLTLAGLVCPVLVVLLFPLLRRDHLPAPATLEQLGKKSFGLYLTNLIVLNGMLAVVQALAPGLFGALWLLVPLLFVFTVVVPHGVMMALERWPTPAVHRYVFG